MSILYHCIGPIACGMLSVSAISCKNGSPVNPTPVPPAAVTRVEVAAPPLFVASAPGAPALSSMVDAPRVLPEMTTLETEEMDPKDLTPHHLRLTHGQSNTVFGISNHRTYVSADGSTGMVRLDNGNESDTLVFRSLDGQGRDVDLPLMNVVCTLDVPPGTDCLLPETAAQVRIANKLLAKHSWVMLREYWSDGPAQGYDNCGTEDLTRHFRFSLFEVLFKAPRLRIVRNDGVVITDRDYDVHDPSTLGKCREGTRPHAGMFAIDLERRAMAVSLHSCYTEGCPTYDRFYFFRLPHAGTPPATKTP